jgi:hypothetical protein
MAVGIGINLTKIKAHQERLMKEQKITKSKNGDYWLNLVQVETPQSQYTDYKLSESTTKEERDAGNWGEVFGNGKQLGQKPNTNVQAESKTPVQDEKDNDPFGGGGEDDLPF